METIELNVGGMTCGGCENSVRNAILRLPGVLSVTADHATGRVIVDAENAMEKATITAAVEDAGYEVVPEGRTHLPMA